MKTIRTPRARERFLAVLGEQCNVAEACRAASISRTAAYAWRADDAEFAADWKQAEETAADALEKVAWERATTGQSDRMLEILLKGHRPEKYVERHKLDHSGGVAITKIIIEAADGNGQDPAST